MDKTSPDAIRLTFVFGTLALILPAWMALYVPYRDKRKALLEARDEVLEPLKLYPPDTTASLGWLLPRWSQSMVYGSQDTERKLDAWLKSSKPVMIIDGGPLVGKTRMAIEWAGSLGPEWETGWLRHDKDAGALKQIAAYGRNTVMVVDGAPPHLAELVQDLIRHKTPPQIRVLLTLRRVQGSRIENPYAAAVIEEVTPLHLGPLGEAEDRERWFEELCRHYADRLGVPVPAQRHGFIRELDAVPIGVLHAAALAAARTGAVPLRSRGIEELMYELWKTEVDSWRNTPGVPGSGRGEVGDAQLDRLEHAVVALALLEPGNLQIAVGLLEKIPALSGSDTGTLKDIVAWAARMYPPASSSGLAAIPRIIVVTAFLHAAANDRNFGHWLLGSLTDLEASAVLSQLVGAAPLLPSAAVWATVVIDSNPKRLSTAVEIALAAAPSSRDVDMELARCAGWVGLNEDQTISLQERIHEGWLPMMKVALGQLRVEQLRSRVSLHVGKYESELGWAICDLALWLNAAGGHTAEALDAAQEAVTIFRRLVAASPDRHEHDLAVALDTLANQLMDAGGRTAEALDASQESVTIYRRLAKTNLALYEPLLAVVLGTLSKVLAAAGGFNAEALDIAQESVTIFRSLAHANPARHEPGLAPALATLASRLTEAGGRPDKALDIAQESVTIYRRLADANPNRYEPGLAAALVTLVRRLETERRTLEALDLAQESVTVYRRLANTNPALYEPGLAAALDNLARLLADAGRTTDAMQTARKSVTIYRRLARTNPARHERDLAAALDTLASRFMDAGGRTVEALDAARESVTILRRLANTNPALYEPRLAGVLHNLANLLGKAGGRTVEALNAAQESVTIFRRLANTNPALHEPGLALALHNLAIRFADAGNASEASESLKELLPLYERLARQESRFVEPLAQVKRTLWERGLP